MGKIQNKTGRAFEVEICEYFKKNGTWCYQFPTKQGQPCDVIATFNNNAFFYECKTSATDTFDCKRIEANQSIAYEYIKSCGCKLYYLLVKFRSGVNVFKMEDALKCDKLHFGEGAHVNL